MTTNPPLTAEQIDADRKAHKIASEFAIPGGSWALYNAIVAYAAQQCAELAGQVVRLEADYKLATEEIKVLKGELAQAELKASQRGKAWIELSAENERLKQYQRGLIPLAAWAKEHGHSMGCDMRSSGVIKNCSCTCGWAVVHHTYGLTVAQHLELAAYSESQPPKEAT